MVTHRTSFLALTVLTLGLLGFLAPLAHGEGFLCDHAKPAVRPAGAPKYSDVSMRLFRKREGGAELTAAEAFHITRADWCYIRDKAYIDAVHARGWTFQGATNAVTNNPDFALKDENGQPVLDHFKKPGRFWADCNNEPYRAWYVDQLKHWVDVGVDSIQRDEPTAIRHWPIPDAVAYFEDVHARLKKAVGRDIPMSVNLAWNGSRSGGAGEPITGLFDFGMAEIGPKHVTPVFFREAARDARERGKAVIYTCYRDLGIPTYRLAIACCYANGMQFIVPWDQFAGTTEPRVFARPEDLADLYGFVRANAENLDGYEEAAVAAHGLEGDSDPPCVVAEGDAVIAHLRAKPGDHAAPVVIHVVAWNPPSTARLRLRTADFFGGAPLAVTLRTPAPYDAAAHADAEKTQSYAALAESRPLDVATDGSWTDVALPDLTPWGILIVRTEDTR